MMAGKRDLTGTEEEGPVGRLSRRRLRSGRYLVRPCGLARSHWEMRAAILCCVALASILILELQTPNDVVAALGLLPLLAAMWLLSTRFAAIVTTIAALCFALSLLVERQNQVTLLYFGSAAAVIALTTRLYATGLAELLSRPTRPFGASVAGVHLPLLADTALFVGGIAALTPRELEVARLTAQGYTALEVSQRLHIAQPTVETHVARVYAKLGINTKGQLIRMSSRFSPVPVGSVLVSGSGPRASSLELPNLTS